MKSNEMAKSDGWASDGKNKGSKKSIEKFSRSASLNSQKT